jgi:hypothetical protein
MDQFFDHLWALWEWSKSALALFGIAGISIAGVVGAAFTLFKLLGEKWLNQKFAERLEAYKSEQARELERLRHRIGSVFDRAKRLNDREYEVLPDVWGKIVDAKSASAVYLTPLKQYADISRMDDATLSEHLSKMEFSESERRDILSSTNQQKIYQQVVEWHNHVYAMNMLREAHSSISKNGIFVVPELRADMKKLIDIVHGAVIEQRMNEEEDLRPRLREGRDQLKNEGEPLFEKLENAVAARLWDSVTTEV